MTTGAAPPLAFNARAWQGGKRCGLALRAFSLLSYVAGETVALAGSRVREAHPRARAR